MSSTWHADPAVLARYAAADLDDIRAASLEAHLLACAGCRDELAPLAPAAQLDAMWSGIEATLDAPHPGLVERGLVRLGVHDHVARLLAATPSLRMSWFSAEALALVSAAVAAAHAREASGGWLFVFLVLAALAPVAGVAAAFGPGADPVYEVGIAAPMRSDRLLFIRTIAVLVASVAIAGLAALALPGLDRSIALWLLPALGLTLATLVVATWLQPIAAACSVGLAWLAVAAGAAVAASDPLAAFHVLAQLAYVVTIGVSLLILAFRHVAYEGRIPA
jgi:hypothetical protein